MIFIATTVLLVTGIYIWKREQLPEERQITWNLETDNITKAVCDNSFLSRKQVTVVAEEEIRTIVTGLKALSFEYDAEIQKQQNDVDGGYCQVLCFYDEDNKILDSMEIESSTAVLYSYKGHFYRGMIPADSELSKLLSDLLAEYWAKPGERTGRWNENKK